MRHIFYILFLTLFMTFTSCKKQESTVVVTSPTHPTNHNDTLQTNNTDTTITYPIQYPLAGIYEYATNCIYPKYDTSYVLNGTIQFITADSVRLYNLFEYDWNSVITLRLDTTNQFHYYHGHRTAGFQLNGDSVYYWLHIWHYSTDGNGCNGYEETSFSGKIIR